MRLSLVATVVLIASSAHADKLAAPRPVARLAGSGVDTLGVWNFRDHYRKGRLEAGLVMNSDSIVVKMTSPAGSRRYWLFRGGTEAVRAIIDVPRRGAIRVLASPDLGWQPTRPLSAAGFIQTTLGESTRKRAISIRVTE